ncbi:zinc finger protein 574 isoform X2 [Esox lucius]|uniref:zinc finger protein 574 isoform X2 n=1 Tax=Esox lucius TaxID=8010 RepID=UPI001476FD38|nr:zinc finger protein 574 isoform X2 [Esox lucius]
MDSSALYLCSSCCQIFDSLEVVASHQLTCQPVDAAPPAAWAKSPGVALYTPHEPAQHHLRAQKTVSSRLHLGSSLFKSNGAQTQIQNSPALLIRYQCRECETLFESLGLWQKHSKLGSCSTATGSELVDQDVGADCRSEIINEKGREGWRDGGRRGTVEVKGDREREDEIDEGGGTEREHSAETRLESETNSDSQKAPSTTPMPINPVTFSSNPVASSFGQTFFCAACGSGFSTEALLVLHRTTTHGLVGALHHCEVCGEGFMNTTKYLYHRKQHRMDPNKPRPLFQLGRINAVLSDGVKIPTGPPVTLATTTPDRGPSRPTPDPPLGPRPQCGNCGNAHIRAHAGLAPFKCDLCPKALADNSNMASHRFAHSARKRYTCLRCGKSYTQLGTLKNHHVLHERRDALSRGGERLEGGVEEEGMKKYPPFFRYKCPDCPRCFRRYSQVPVHRYSHTGRCPFTCSVCGDHFFHKSRLKRHALTHQDADTGPAAKGTCRGRGRGWGRGRRREGAGLLECEFCRHRCVTKEGLDLHRLSHTGQTPLRCPVNLCRRRYAAAAGLKKHLITHCPAPGDTVATADRPKPRPFHCHHCGKDFTTGSSLSVHIRVHTGERPFQCAQCGKRFRQIPHLRDHERLHSGERPFVCGVCGKSFVLAARLAEHARTHSGDKPFSCSACHRAFRSLSNLGKHRKTPLCRPPPPAQPPKDQGVTDHVGGQSGLGTILLVQPQTVSQEGCPLPLHSSPPTPLVLLHPSIAAGDEPCVLQHAIEVIVEQAAE